MSLLFVLTGQSSLRVVFGCKQRMFEWPSKGSTAKMASSKITTTNKLNRQSGTRKNLCVNSPFPLRADYYLQYNGDS